MPWLLSDGSLENGWREGEAFGGWDNEAARHCLIKGVSGSKSMQQLCRAFYDIETALPYILLV